MYPRTLLGTMNQQIKAISYFRYTSSAETGYVAKVTYEGTPVFPAVVAAPQQSARLQARPAQAPGRPQQGSRSPAQAGRAKVKRNENSLPSEYDALKEVKGLDEDVELKFFSATS